MKAVKQWLMGLGVMALVGGAATTANAIDLRNEDERAYPMTVVSASMSRDMELRALTMSIVVCVGECEFRVPGVGATKARGNDTVTIRNGRLVVERAEPAAAAAKPATARR
jgi:hypothetical protein